MALLSRCDHRAEQGNPQRQMLDIAEAAGKTGVECQSRHHLNDGQQAHGEKGCGAQSVLETVSYSWLRSSDFRSRHVTSDFALCGIRLLGVPLWQTYRAERTFRRSSD